MFCYFLYILLRLGRSAPGASWESPDRVRQSERRVASGAGGGTGAAAPRRADVRGRGAEPAGGRGRGRGAVSTSATTENSASGRASSTASTNFRSSRFAPFLLRGPAPTGPARFPSSQR